MRLTQAVGRAGDHIHCDLRGRDRGAPAKCSFYSPIGIFPRLSPKISGLVGPQEP